MATKKKKPKGAFNPAIKIGDFIIQVKGIVLNIGDNALIFVTPSPTLPSVTTAINALDIAETAVTTGTLGTIPTRDAAYDAVVIKMVALLAYVQGLADLEPDYVIASGIIIASGFALRGHTPFAKPPLRAKLGTVAGTVVLIAKAVTDVAKVAYEWNQSTDGVTWTILSPTTKARTITGILAVGKYYFRLRATSSKAQSPWSDAIDIYVPN